MGAVQQEIEEQAVAGTRMSDVFEELDLDGAPRAYQPALVQQRRSLTMTIPKKAWTDADRSLSNPGAVDAYYFESSEMLLIDLSNNE